MNQLLILAFNQGHDATIAAIENGRLLFSVEAEKDSSWRYSSLTPEALVVAAKRLDRLPDVVAIGGWVEDSWPTESTLRAGYFGAGSDMIRIEKGQFFGRAVDIFSSTHERSHIMAAYGLSPFAAGCSSYCLVWEGYIGSFYRINEVGEIHHMRSVLSDPGNKYSFLYALADPSFSANLDTLRLNDAGKQMALTGFADRQSPPPGAVCELVESILNRDQIVLPAAKSELSSSPLYNVGVESQFYKNAAAWLSDAIFNRFYSIAASEMTEGLPLVISGGCGLNCEWNRRWRDCGLFPEVFVPPCPNDSGSALGTAIDAQHHYTRSAALEWDVYAGDQFVEDVEFELDRFDVRPLDYTEVARFLADGMIVGWARGRWEMGPRALGNRSILAAPFEAEMTNRLNYLKQREPYRPIAPICLAADADKWFDGSLPDPYMLYFSQVTTDRLKAVTHVDGSARVQTVTHAQNAGMADLLTAFRKRTGFSVLCNTSLNFKGRGFINRTSDLICFGEDRGLDGYVVNDTFATRRTWS